MHETRSQELDTYNKLSEYENIANDLDLTIQEDMELSIQQKQDILYPIIDEIRDLSNNLITKYLKHLKDKENQDLLLELRDDIQGVLERIDLFRNKVYEIYKINDKENNI